MNAARIRNSDRAPLPAFVAPCLATPVIVPPASSHWTHEIKFDGYRVIARIDNGAVQLFTRNGHDWTDRFLPVAAELGSISAKQVLLDGEIVVRERNGASDFSALVADLKARRADRLEFMAFDILHLDGRDVRSHPLVERKRALATLIDKQRELVRVQRVEGLTADGPDVLAAACAMHLEGIVSKRLDHPYRSGRQSFWVKSKCQRIEDFTVVGFLPMHGAPHLVGALVVATGNAAGLTYVGRVGSGFTSKTAAQLFARLTPLRVSKTPLKAIPADADQTGVVWTRPQLTVRVQFREQLANGVLRHAVFKAIRDPE